MVYLLYTTYISASLAHLEIFSAKVGKGGIMLLNHCLLLLPLYVGPCFAMQ